MELLILELIWWGCLFLFFWALRDGRIKRGDEGESLPFGEPQAMPLLPGLRFQHPNQVREPIGSYQGAPIHRYAEMNGRLYQFDRVCPPEAALGVKREELYLAPGLVYQECRADD